MLHYDYIIELNCYKEIDDMMRRFKLKETADNLFNLETLDCDPYIGWRLRDGNGQYAWARISVWTMVANHRQNKDKLRLIKEALLEVSKRR